MTLKRFAGVLALGIGAVAGAAAVVTRSLRHDEPLEHPLDGPANTFRWRGLDVHYTEAGDPDDPVLVLFHGINAAASSGEWRTVVADLAESYHVVAPDLPGFGCSDRPPLRYSSAFYEEFVTDFLDHFESPAVVASGLTGAYVVRAAQDTVVDRLVLVCPTSVAGPEPPTTWLRELIRSPVLGELCFALLTSRPAIRYFNADHGYYSITPAEDEWFEYEWKTAHVENARFAPASFISGSLNADVDLAADLADLEIPITLVWGRDAVVTPLAAGREIADAADCRLVVFDRAKLLPHVEYPDQFVAVTKDAVPVPTV